VYSPSNTSYAPWTPQVFSVPITGVQEPGRQVMISYDYDFWFNGSAAQFFCFHEKIYLVPVSTLDGSFLVSTTTGLKRARYFEVPCSDDFGADHVSTEAANGAVKLYLPRNGSTIVDMPADADTVDYKAVFVWHLDTTEIAYSSGNQYGCKNPNSAANRRFGLEDLELHCIHYKR
jgi:hypothetical protein